MARKKDFAEIKTGRQVFTELERAAARPGQQGTASPQEAAERAEALRTQGRKGCKATRINCAFSPSNHEYIKIMARATGHTMTETVNAIIEKYRDEHPEHLAKAREFLDDINNGPFSKLPGMAPKPDKE